jgi:class 3 adenylate cyclase
MQQISDWLQKLGMSEYAQRFAENGISFAALRHLTDQDLKDIGVLLGHRRIMLAAIQELAATTPSPPVPTELARQDDAERRQLTVMFTDLVSSTALSTRLDPEDLRSVFGAYHKCVAKTVARFDGLVAKYMGDGVLIYFGAACHGRSIRRRAELQSGTRHCESAKRKTVGAAGCHEPRAPLARPGQAHRSP